MMRPSEVCELLAIHPRTLQRMASRGDLAAVELPSGHRRYKRHDVEALIAGSAGR